MSSAFVCPLSFEELISGKDDPLGLLSDVKPAKAKSRTTVSGTEQKFLEIVDFYQSTGRPPEEESEDFHEKLLATRLQSYRTQPRLKAQVESLDVCGLLKETQATKPEPKKESLPSFASFDELLSNDASGLLDDIDGDIFALEHVKSAEPDTRSLPDEIATRTHCEDFFKFEKLFADTQKDILNRKLETIRFKNGSQIDIGDFFIVNGILCFVDSIVKESVDRHNRDNPRIRVIFDNGMETDILKLSLAKALYNDENGRRVLPDPEKFAERFSSITHKDKATGCIYILASETKAPELAEFKRQGRLVKIGYSSQSVEERIKGAEEDPTYLEAPVRILASLDCYNLNPQKVEHLIHAFLSKQRINMTLISSKGKPYHPTEWFAVDRNTAITVAQHIVQGDIMKYRMDNTTGKIKQIA